MTYRDQTDEDGDFSDDLYHVPRHRSTDPFEGAVDGPRLGRRESEPHSSEINYLWDVLHTNFPNDRVMWDLTHYFKLNNQKITIQFDISFFTDFSIPEKISSYDASAYQNRLPSIAINVLSTSTWRKDFADNLEKCRRIKIPLYVVFFAYPVKNEIYSYPYLRLYQLQADGEYKSFELHETVFEENILKNPNAIIDCGRNIPFRIGLMRIKEVFKGGEPLYRLILLHKDKLDYFKTKSEIVELQLQAEKQRADDLEKRLQQFIEKK